MKHARKLFLALSCAVLCLVCGFTQAQQAQPASGQAPAARKAPNLLVGVVDLRSVLQTHPVVVTEIPALSAKLQEEQVALAKAKEEADNKVAKLQQELNLAYGTPEFEEKVSDIRKDFSDAEFKAREVQQKLVAQRTQLLFQAYTDLQNAIEVVAKQNGILIVHSKVKIAVPENSGVSKEAVQLEEADQNTIIWNRPECDITEQVKAQLAVVAKASNAVGGTTNPLDNLGAQAINARANSAAAPAPKRTASAPANPRR